MISSGNNSSNTTTQVIHNDGSISNSIRSLFIYGTGALRLQLTRVSGSPGTRAFIIGSTIGADFASKFLNNTINDPNYVKSHVDSWKSMFLSNDSAKIEVDNDSFNEIKNGLTPSTTPITDSNNSVNKLLPDGNGFEELSNKFINNLLDILKSILEPVQVDYSNEILANQLYHISIILFILSIFIIILFIGFLINLLVLLYSDKIMNYFTNKYIRAYINFNKKIIGIEVSLIGFSILYFMYCLTYGLYFLATHPIPFS